MSQIFFWQGFTVSKQGSFISWNCYYFILLLHQSRTEKNWVDISFWRHILLCLQPQRDWCLNWRETRCFVQYKVHLLCRTVWWRCALSSSGVHILKACDKSLLQESLEPWIQFMPFCFVCLLACFFLFLEINDQILKIEDPTSVEATLPLFRPYTFIWIYAKKRSDLWKLSVPSVFLFWSPFGVGDC